MVNASIIFLVADTQILGALSVRRSVGPSVTLKLKTQKTRIYDAAVVIECACVSVWQGGWGEAGGWLPLLTHPQRYWFPASLVPESEASTESHNSFYFVRFFLL